MTAAFKVKFFFKHVTMGQDTSDKAASKCALISKDDLFMAFHRAANLKRKKNISFDKFKKAVQNYRKNHKPKEL